MNNIVFSCARLLHRYERSAEHLTHLRAKFPLTLSCGRPCTQSERRKRDPAELPPVGGCGPKKVVFGIFNIESVLLEF